MAAAGKFCKGAALAILFFFLPFPGGRRMINLLYFQGSECATSSGPVPGQKESLPCPGGRFCKTCFALQKGPNLAPHFPFSPVGKKRNGGLDRSLLHNQTSLENTADRADMPQRRRNANLFVFGPARSKGAIPFPARGKERKARSREGEFRFSPSPENPIPLKRPRRGLRPLLLDSPPERRTELQASIVSRFHFARWSGSGKRRTTCLSCTKPAKKSLRAGAFR